MDSTGSSSGSITGSDASQLLKDMLNVGLSGDLVNSTEAVPHKPPTTPNRSFNADLLNSLSSSITKQKIVLQGTDNSNSFSIYGRDVDVISSKLSSGATSGSNKVKITPVVNFDWENKFYPGNLVAVHKKGVFIAYVLKGKNGAVVRLINRKTAQRALLKGYQGQVTDLAFAHCDTIILGAVDEIGNTFVHEVSENEDMSINTLLTLHVTRTMEEPSDHHHIIWCPYIPDSSEDSHDAIDNVSKLLVVTHNEKAEMLNVEMIIGEHGHDPIKVDDIQAGLLNVDSHSQPIVEAAFSPDGSALATASLDGYVKFFQVYMQDRAAPRCLHEWKPHGGQPLSSLFFLDDHKNPNSEVQFWKYAVTGAANNTEIKVWSCESWTCLQTIRLLPSDDLPSNFQVEPTVKAVLDLSSRYLVLSDIKRKVIYVLYLHQDNTSNTAHVSSLSEFVLASQCLSFAVLDASRKKVQSNEDVDDYDDNDTDVTESLEDDSNDISVEVCIKMYAITPKSLEDLQIRFKPLSSVPQSVPSSAEASSREESVFRDGLSDMSMSVSVDSSFHTQLIDLEESKDAARPVLLTPDAFTSTPSPRLPAVSTPDSSLRLSSTSSVSFTQVSALNDDLLSHTDTTATLTPRSSHDTDNVVTPSTLPLPPVTPNEENSLKVTNQEKLDDMFSKARHQLRGSESSSSTSQEVSEILAQSDISNMAADAEEEDEDMERESNEDHSEEQEEQENYEYSWPKAPSVPAVSQNKSEENTEDVKIEYDEVAEVEKQEYHPVPSAGDTGKAYQSSGDMTNLSQLQESVHHLTTLIQAQQAQIQHLNTSLHHHLMSPPTAEIKELRAQLDRLENNMASKVESSIKQHTRAENQRLQQALSGKQPQEDINMEKLTQSVNRAVNKAVSEKLEKTFRDEIKNKVLPTLTTMIDPIKQQLHKDLSQKLTATDAVVKESFGKLIKSRQTVDAIGQAAGASILGTVQSTYKESFHNMVIPSFERAMQEMLKQINVTFQERTKEYIRHLDNHVEMWHRKQKDYRDPVITQFQGFVQEFNRTVSSLQANVSSEIQTTVDRQLNGFLHSLTESLTADIRHLVKDEVSSVLKSHQDSINDSILQAVRTGAATPIPVHDRQHQEGHIVHLIRQGEINTAFQQALSASDLQLVMFVCENVDASHVFNQSPCPLQQPVLLSMIQQLSADLDLCTELKHKYLQEAVMNLDSTNQVTREHMPSVLVNLTHKLQTFIQTHPTDKMTRSMKMLLMAAQSLLK